MAGQRWLGKMVRGLPFGQDPQAMSGPDGSLRTPLNFFFVRHSGDQLD
jgi:hypothetical protein